MGKNLFTIDVEDWFQVENLKSHIGKKWDDKQLRVIDNTKRILELLERKNVRGTFFVLGWLAERAPGLVEEIASRGHEVASHGYGHDLIYSLSEDEFRADIVKSKKILEGITGKKVVGYRAPSFSITDWALKVLYEEGFAYDSSYFDFGGHDRYGKLNVSKQAIENKPFFKTSCGMIEVPITTLKIASKNLPWSGGGYFRLIPYPVFKLGYEQAIKQKKAAMFYFHPWEIDDGQPRVTDIKKSYQFRHYYGLKKSCNKLEKLLDTFSFCPVTELINSVEMELNTT